MSRLGGGDADSRSKPAPPGGDWLVDDDDDTRGASGNNWEGGDRDTGTSEWDTGTSNWQKTDSKSNISSNWETPSPNTASNNWETSNATNKSSGKWQEDIDTGSSTWNNDKPRSVSD